MKTLTEQGKFSELVTDMRSLLVGLELTNKEGDALIEEIRIRMRRPEPQQVSCSA